MFKNIFLAGYTLKFVKYAGLINWLIIVPYIIFTLTGDMSIYPEPTPTVALMFLFFGILALTVFIGSYCIIPVSYLAIPILLIYDFLKGIKTKNSNQTNVIKSRNLYIEIFGIIGFILGGVVAFLVVNNNF